MEINVNWLAAPVLMPLSAAALILALLRVTRTHSLLIQRSITAITLLFHLALSAGFLVYTAQHGRLVMQMGLWPAPFGITLVLDGLSAIMLMLTAILAGAILPYAIGTLDVRERLNFYPLMLFLMAGVNGAFLAGDLFNLYVFFEVLLMGSFVLLTLGGRVGQVKGGIRYVILNLMTSTIFLASAGVAYGTLGTLNLAHLAQRLETAPIYLQILLAGLLIVVFSSKAGLFPLFFWLPASYHTTHPAITAFFGGLLTKVGIYTLFRFFPLLFPTLLVEWQPLILTVAALTMLTGVLGAMAVNTVRRVLSFHIISQVGYMVMGLGVAVSGNQLAVGFGMTAAILYLVHHMIVKTALLMAGGVAELEAGSGSLIRGKLGGLMGVRPVLAVIFFIAAMSLAGIPPSSGFIAKLSLLQITLDVGQWPVALVSVVVSVLTMMSMARLWQYSFWGEKPTTPSPYPILARRRSQWLILSPIAALIALSLSIGLFTEPFFQLSRVAAEQALDRQGYIEAVNIAEELIAGELPAAVHQEP